MLQSNFKTKLNSAEHRRRRNKWCVWKALQKNNPEKYKIKIDGDEKSVTLMLLERSDGFEYVDYWKPIEFMEWSLE